MSAREAYPIGYEDGYWTIRFPAGSAFMANAVTALAYAIGDRKPGPTRDVFERLLHACIEASPE